MIKENKIRKTPEEVKKARAARIKARAEAIYNAGIGLMLLTPSSISKLKASQSEEDADAILRSLGDHWAEKSILMASRFDDIWKKKRGSFIHDDV